MEINWRKKSKKPCVSEKNRITCLKFAPEPAGVSSSGSVTCGLMSPRLAVTTNHSSMYGEQNKKQAEEQVQNKKIEMMNCPAQSQDLHPIEILLVHSIA